MASNNPPTHYRVLKEHTPARRLRDEAGSDELSQSANDARDLVLGSGPAQVARASGSGTFTSPGLAAPGELLSAVRRLSYTGANNASNRLVSGLVWRRRNSSCLYGPPTTACGAGQHPPAATPGR